MKAIHDVATELFQSVKAKFPNIEEINRIPSPEDRDHIWVRVYAPLDEDTQDALQSYSAELEADILDDYGYRISIIPLNERYEELVS